MAKRIILFVLAVFLTVLLGLILPKHWLAPLFHNTAYYFILAAFVFWIALALKIFHTRFFSFLKAHWPALLLSISLMALIFYMMPPQFKVLADETNLVGVSMAMHQDKTVSVPLQGLSLDYSDFDYESTIGKRPLLFPFVVSIVHAVIGYSPYNGFVVNFIVGAGILFLIYVIVSLVLSSFYGIIAIFLTASLPIFSIWLTSSGFEALNLFYLLFVFLIFYQFLKNQTVDYAEFLFLSLILLACCRYESLICFLGLVVILPSLVKKSMIKGYRFTTFCLPFFFLPILWQRRIAFYQAIIREGEHYETASEIFGFSNFFNHISDNIFVLSGLNSNFGFLPIISVAAIVGIYFLTRKLIFDFRKMKPEDKLLFAFGSLIGLAIFLIYAAFYFGDLTRPVSNRLAISFLPFIIFGAVYCLHLLNNRPDRYKQILLMLLVITQFIFYTPVAADQKIIDGLSLTYEYSRVLDYIYDNFDLKNEKILLISDLPNLYVIHGVGSVDFSYANQNKKKLNTFKNIFYDHILAIQKQNLVTGEVKNGNYLAHGFEMEKLIRLNINPAFYITISRLKHLDSYS